MGQWDITAKKGMKKIAVLLLLGILIVMPSCMSTRTSVQNFKEAQGEQYLYAKGRQCYLFWGLIPLGRTSVATPVEQPCQIRTRFGFWDAFLTTITAGIFSMQQIRVYAKRTPDDQNYFKTGDEVTYKRRGKYQKGRIDSVIDSETCVVMTADGKLKKMEFENLSK